MHFKKIHLHLIGLLSMALSLLPVCVMAATSERLVIADAKGDWGPLSPYLHADRGPGYIYTSFIFDTLVWKNKQGKLVPLLAETWGSDNSHRCHYFTLNRQARWHDGTPLTAQDVAFTFNYTEKHPHRFIDTGKLKSVTVKGNRVNICLNQPDVLFIERIGAALPILPEHIYTQVDDPSRFYEKAALIGSGPYRLKNYQRTQGFYHLLRNEQWYRGRPRYREVIITRLSPQAAATAMQRGEVDLMSIPYDFSELFRRSGTHILQAPSNHPYRLLFNHQQRFSNKLLRYGIAHTINRKQLIELAFHGQALPARPTYSQQGSLQGLDSYAFDPVKAGSLLKMAGWQQNSSGQWLDEQQQPIQLKLIAAIDADQLAKVLARQLTDFGFSLTLSLLQDIPLTQALHQQDFDLALLSISHQGDPDRFRTMITGQNNRGDHYLADPLLLDQLERLRYLSDPKKRAALLFKAEQRYNADLPSFPLLNPLNFAAVQPGIDAAFTLGGVAMGIPLPYNKLSLFLSAPTP